MLHTSNGVTHLFHCVLHTSHRYISLNYNPSLTKEIRNKMQIVAFVP
uniref:Uncharacterized protein n=1 Tax=Anguilla anguilla TaxID=7936 RepID=A0A0E9WNX9_ANGAN